MSRVQSGTTLSPTGLSPTGGLRIGDLLLAQGALTPAQVEHILLVQKTTGRPFGDLAERLYGVAPDVVEGAWVRQFAAASPAVDLSAESPSAVCLSLVDRRQAWQFRLLPLCRVGEHLRLATAAGSLVRAVNFSARHFDEPVDVFLASEGDLNAALMRHYQVPTCMAQMAGGFRIGA